MRKSFCLQTILISVAGLYAAPGFAQSGPAIAPDTTGTLIVPSTSSSFNQQGFNLPSVPRSSGQDIVRGTGGVSCQSSVGTNGPVFDMGVIGTNDIYSRDSAALYGRITVPLGKKPKRIDCSRLYELEVQRLKMEIQMMRAGHQVGALFGHSSDSLKTRFEAARQSETAAKFNEPSSVQPTHKTALNPSAPARNTLDADGAAQPDTIKPKTSAPTARPTPPDLPRSGSPAPMIRTASAGRRFTTLFAKADEPVSLTRPDPVIVPAKMPDRDDRFAHIPPIFSLPKSDGPAKADHFERPAPRIARLSPLTGASAPSPASHAYRTHEFDKKDLPPARPGPARTQRLSRVGQPDRTQTYYAQLGAFSSLSNSRRAVTTYQAQFPDFISDYEMIAKPLEREGRTLFLLQAGPLSRRDIQVVCDVIGDGCHAVRSDR